MAGELERIEAKRKSPQETMKAKKAATAIPGEEIGRIILKSVPILLDPSIKAASSNSLGMPSK
ncbi:unnamed protein product [marine sediment metagenome]|uniref:Uncharacterized protein n=1 Tax=marine sediment metagenome TaxID=412755 RepID=X1MB25_9ZZZZ